MVCIFYLKSYQKDFPDAKGKILTVKHVIKGFNGASAFEPGDIFLEVNNQPIGPNLLDLSRVIDAASGTLKFKILRNEIEKEVYKTDFSNSRSASYDDIVNALNTILI